MEFLSVIPNNVTNPTIDPIEIQPPYIVAATTPPIRANGRLNNVIAKFLRDPNAIYSISNTVKPARIEKVISSSRALLFSIAAPVIS